MNRKTFLKNGLLLGGTLSVTPLFGAINSESLFDFLEIQEFVSAAHKDLEATKNIIEAKPLLLNCVNQVKRGDFETAMGGACHMGRKDIADLLLSKGARLDIFNLVFLGYHDLAKQLIKDFPHLLHAPGPHGFTLLHHAKVGDHQGMATWLEEQGLDKTHLKGIF